MRQVMIVVAIGAAAVLSGCQQERTLYAVRQSGEEALAERDYQTAVTDFGEYVARAPERAEGHYGYGRALLAVGRTSEAVEQLWIARGNMLGNIEVYETLVEALYQDGQYEQMYGLLRERMVEGSTARDHLRFGYYAQKVGDDDQAHRAFRTAARIDAGQTVEPQIALADFYRTIGQYDEELRRLRMAYYIDPDNEEVHRRIRRAGEIPGPTIKLRPEEAPVIVTEDPASQQPEDGN